ncbi:deoxyhypusine synthase family protein [Stratiformator vulcanicus]|uniref:Putative deoxyhypusine synthase n=1 Tax=Stratiformator vulcanicus TaxID=2527980 RepID=A0A517R0W3_9PLAN|nr:deoxyhypusine synthase family protein [Stratiformator vulcanicus]QDT37483.1 putative deoxyhypusine synthase [Stratiformator vulcanicus]
MSRELHDGRSDGLRPLKTLDLAEVNTFPDLLRAMGDTAFSGRQLGESFDVLLEMARDTDCKVVLTLSGAMTVAKQGRIFCELIDRGIVHAVISTGALMAHGLTESIGLTHYRYDPSQSDEDLFEKGYNRVYDTLEMESNLNDVERVVSQTLRTEQPEDGVWSSARLCKALGKALSEMDEGPGILKSAYEQNVPVFIPAFSDSEVGLDVSTWAMGLAVKESGKSPSDMTPEEMFRAVPPFNPFLDLQEYARFIGESDRIGIFTIGGGVPRNWAQQVAPYYDITNHRIGTEFKAPRFRYGVRICPEPVHWGGLSGCTYSEGVSWGKFVSPKEGGRFAEVYADATVVLPILCKAIFDELT